MHIYLYTHTYMYIYHIVCMWKIYPACYLRITWLIEYVGYLYWILISENMFKCNAFFVSNLILKSDVNSIWILSFSCSYQKVSMYTTTCTKILENSFPHAPSRVRCSEKSSSRWEGGKLPRRNRIRKRRKQWRLKVYIIFKTCC